MDLITEPKWKRGEETVQCRVHCFSLVTGLIKSLQSFLYKITHLVRSVLKLAELDTRTPTECLLKHFKLLGKKG